MNELFMDTAYPLALSFSGDPFQEKALEWLRRIEAEQRRIVTTRAVLLEIGNALSKLRYRAGAVTLLKFFEADPRVEIVPLTEELYAKAFALYEARPDKEWGMVDCISFVVMRERGIADALTSDEHFRQAGFLPLMREL